MPVTTEELDKVVRDANLTVRLDPEKGPNRTFQTFKELKDFFQQESDFWRTHGSALPKIQSNFTLVVNALDQAARESDIGRVRTKIDEVVSLLKKPDLEVVYSGTQQANCLVTLSGSHPVLASHALQYLKAGPRTGSRGEFEGAFAVAAFKYPDFFSAGLDARVQESERQLSAISELRERVVEHHETFKDETGKWRDATQKSVSEMIQTAEVTFSDVRKNGEEALSKTNDEWANKLDEAFTAWRRDLAAIKAAYDEQMKLQEPADYWKELEKEYDAKGYRWVKAAAAAVGGLVIAVAALVYRPPGLFTEAAATLGGIKGVLLIAAGVSMVVYLITLFVRFATSSYHLARDARERLQLTHVFLALIKKAAIEQKDRDVILPSLFSRADTGLLKGDSGPSFPTPLQAVIDSFRK